MPALNPFLRAFFKSAVASQCSPVNQHILLVPTTETLLTCQERETDTPLAEFATSEDFLGSHVLRIPLPPPGGSKEVGNVRENRTKAKQFNTINGKTVVIKESFVYSNKGFRNLTQAQLLSDTLYYQDGFESQQWLIYYISRPLVGIVETLKIPIAQLPVLMHDEHQKAGHSRTSSETSFTHNVANKKDIKSFATLLASFPVIARQMQPGLDKVFKEFSRDVSKPLPSSGSKSPALLRRRTSSTSSANSSNGSVLGGPTYSQRRRSPTPNFSAFADDEEDHMRRTLESAVTAAIDLFQLVDKQQLSHLGATTELTGPIVERLIERYVAERVHDPVLFPRLCNIHRADDIELESRIHQMLFIDIAQVGIDIDGGRLGKDRLTSRLNNGIEQFKNLNNAESPQRMLDILLETQKTIASGDEARPDISKSPTVEKPISMAMNADALVSLLLIVVIRSQVHYLQARLAYMRSFIFIDDVEGGELGYALSTFEAVLSYLSSDSGGLRLASRRNRRLWQATKKGNLSEMSSILEPDDEGSISDDPDSLIGSSLEDHSQHDRDNGVQGIDRSAFELQLPFNDGLSEAATEMEPGRVDANLSHVFPFQHETGNAAFGAIPRPVKRVSLDLRSLSSELSFHSRTDTLTSMTSVIEGDTSIEKLCQTQDSAGNSVLMMATEARQPEALAYLLSLDEHYPVDAVFEDITNDGTTLLSAAVQSSNPSLIEILVDYTLSFMDTQALKTYLQKSDKMGRTAAHYLFHAPYLISRFGTLLPWRQKDKNGQTPLLALCRCYDHAEYLDMVNEALKVATAEQGDHQPLHMDLHTDGKGNSLLHIVSEPYLALRILQHCDSDPNASNFKRFTPLMVASKFGRFDLVRAMFLDERVDVHAKEYRGMTAVELAKDDEVRNRIDDMILVSNIPAQDGRVTAVVRSFFVEDATIRLIIKTAARSNDGMIAVTTTRRSLADFEHLAKWLSIEHPASWLPSVSNFRSPFQISSKPSRAVLHDIQVRVNRFIEIMLAHSTFSTHELLWEFILVPELQLDMMAQRSLLKSDIRQEKIREEYEPVEDIRDVEVFVSHARESIRAVNQSTKSVLRKVNGVRNATIDFFAALEVASGPLADLPFLPPVYLNAFIRYSKAVTPSESDPYKLFHNDLLAIYSTIFAMLSALSRPHALISSLQASSKVFERHRVSLRRSDRWPLGLLEETRKQAQIEALERLAKSAEEVRISSCELRYTQQTVAAELAGWQDLHGKMGRRAIRALAKRMVVKESDRLAGMKRALRGISEMKKS